MFHVNVQVRKDVPDESAARVFIDQVKGDYDGEEGVTIAALVTVDLEDES